MERNGSQVRIDESDSWHELYFLRDETGMLLYGNELIGIAQPSKMPPNHGIAIYYRHGLVGSGLYMRGFVICSDRTMLHHGEVRCL